MSSGEKSLRQAVETLGCVKSFIRGAAVIATKLHINWDLGYYARCFHAYLEDKMDIPLLELVRALGEERRWMPDRARWDWEGTYHAELSGHLEAVGVSKEQWECSLFFAVEENSNYCAILCEPRRVLNDQLRKDKELLNSELARRAFLPGQKEMFTRLIEEYEAHKFFRLPPAEA